jgi:hypothetical protein
MVVFVLLQAAGLTTFTLVFVCGQLLVSNSASGFVGALFLVAMALIFGTPFLAMILPWLFL